MTGKDGLSDDIRRFRIADQAKSLEPSVCQRGRELVIQAVIGKPVCNHDDRVAEKRRPGGSDDMGNGNGIRRDGSGSMEWEKSHVHAQQSLVNAFPLECVFRPR